MKAQHVAVRIGTLALAVLAASAGADELTLEPGRTEVLVAERATSPTRFAAGELTNFLSRVFGAAVPVVKTPTAGMKQIVVGTNAWSAAEGLDPAALAKPDSFLIRATADRLYLCGCDGGCRWFEEVMAKGRSHGLLGGERASLFAVYEFLEKSCDCRFYFPGELGEIVPRASRVKVPLGTTTHVPDLLIRRYYHPENDLYHGAKGWIAGNEHTFTKGLALNWLRLRMGTFDIPCCHGINRYYYLDRFGKTHPEYFALENGRRQTMTEGHMVGQLCHSSAVWDELYRDVTSYLRGEPAKTRGIIGWDGKNYGWSWQFRGRICDIMPQDGLHICQCDLCKANFGGTAEGIGEWIWKRTADFANRLVTDGFTDVQVTQSAYGRLQHVPATDIPSNVLVTVAERGPWSFATPQEFDREIDEIAAWQRKLGGRKTWIWTYIDKYGAMNIPHIPCGTPRASAAFYRKAAPYVYGLYGESEMDRFLYNALDIYVLSRICWDPSVDTDAVIAEFFDRMFGRAAKEMTEISDLLERKWLFEVAAHTVMTAVGPTARPPDERELWNKVYSPDVIADLTRRFDRAAACVGADSLEGRRVALYRREWLDPLAKAASDYLENSDPQAALRRDAASTRPQLVANGDFTERKFWQFDRRAPKGSFEIDRDTFVSPDRSLRMVSTNNSVVAMQYLDGKNGRPAMKPGRRYRLSFNLKLKDMTPNGRGGVRFVINDGVNNNFPKANSIVGTSDWTHYVYEFTPGPQTNAKTPAYVRIRIDGAAGTAWVDDVRIEELEPQATQPVTI